MYVYKLIESSTLDIQSLKARFYFGGIVDSNKQCYHLVIFPSFPRTVSGQDNHQSIHRIWKEYVRDLVSVFTLGPLVGYHRPPQCLCQGQPKSWANFWISSRQARTLWTISLFLGFSPFVIIFSLLLSLQFCACVLLAYLCPPTHTSS